MNKAEKLRVAAMNTKNDNVWLKDKAEGNVELETHSTVCRLGKVLAKENIHRGAFKNYVIITVQV